MYNESFEVFSCQSFMRSLKNKSRNITNLFKQYFRGLKLYTFRENIIIGDIIRTKIFQGKSIKIALKFLFVCFVFSS